MKLLDKFIAKLKGSLWSRTIWINNLVIILGFIELKQDVIAQLFGPSQQGYVIVGIGLIGIVLRAVTNTDLANKQNTV